MVNWHGVLCRQFCLRQPIFPIPSEWFLKSQSPTDRPRWRRCVVDPIHDGCWRALKSPVAGVAMGLILEESGEFAVLTDILGDEDHLGDMDFKVAGTENGITSLQMDIKVAGITPEIMKQALAQAKDGRMHILGEMAKALTEASEFSIHAPRIETMTVPTDKIREVIGSGGKVIREIVETSGAKVDINDDGVIKIASPNAESIKKAYDMIYSIVAEPELAKSTMAKWLKLWTLGLS